MINVNKLKPGITFQEDDNIFVVITSQHSKQGRGQATIKVKVKNLRTGSISLKSFISSDKVMPALIIKHDMDYLYSDDQNLILMDDTTFEQIEISLEKVKWEIHFLNEGQKVKVRQFENDILDIELPTNIEVQVIEAPSAVKGNTQNNPQKKVKIKTGFELEVPMFIKEGDVIIISTSDGKYVGRGGK